jgi:flagellar hook-basal body complex protein FliE
MAIHFNPTIHLGQISPISLPKTNASAPGAFQAVLESAVQKVENTRQVADKTIDRFLSGEGEELHRVVMASQQAELSLELFQQVRNKVVQAYQEVMRMQL